MDDVQYWWDGWEPIVRILLLGTLGDATLIARQRSARVSSLVDRKPVLLYRRGEVDEQALQRQRQRLLPRDLLGAAREHGLGSLDQAEAVVLQANGSFAVIDAQRVGDGSALAPVEGR